MRALNHQNIIKLYEVYETDDLLCLVMEQIKEQNLKKILDTGSSSLKVNVKKIIFSLLQTLSYLASKGIIHRNIKPQNIVVDDAFNIKITNFGLK